MQKGFTLVEMLVSIALFSVVMVVALGALLALSSATRRAESLNTAVNNLGAAIDSMTRAIRTGTNYHCGTSGNPNTPQDCTASPGSYISFIAADGTQVAYCLDGTVIKRQTIPPGSGTTLSAACSSSNFIPITAPEVTIASLAFYVVGSCPASAGSCSDTFQPKVTVLVSGTIPVSAKLTTEFHLQTSVAQRIYDQ